MSEARHTFDEAVVAYVVRQWPKTNTGALGRTFLQKLLYFARAKGVPLTLEYDIHYYGPFCADLYDIVDWLRADDIIVDSGQANISSFSPGPNMDSVLSEHRLQIAQVSSTLDMIISWARGRTARDMELYATTSFIRNSSRNRDNDNRTIDEVRSIKGSKFGKDEIIDAIRWLSQRGL
jgi:hypothetical protein